MIWAFLLPALTIAVIWVALVYGLRMKELSGGAYSLELVVGLLAWLCFADVISASISSLTSNSHLVKKMVFPIFLLPLARVTAGFLVHIAVVAGACFLFWITGDLQPSNLLVLIFWMAFMWLLCAALSILISALAVIIKDVAEIVPAGLQVLFWSSPIIWPLSSISPNWQGILTSHPMAMIVQGYRTGILGSPFGISWTHVTVAMAATVGGLMISILVFERLKTAFAEEI